MSQSPSKVQFTIGKLDAGMAILLTQDHHQIEFPSILLPKTVTTGSIIDLSVTQNPVEEARVRDQFLSLQSQIRDSFAAKSPSTPRLTLRNATQTSCVLEWDPIDIATAELKSLTLWRDGIKLGNIPKPLSTTTTKLSGLGIDTDYTFQLVLRTTAGTYTSEKLKIRTHKMSNLSGIQVCEGTLPPEAHERLVSAVDAIGAKAIQKRVRIDTTHFVCSVPEGEEWQRAREMNVPIVVVDWIEACQREGKIVGVRGYYLDADPALRPKPSAPSPVQPTSPAARSSQTTQREEKPIDQSVSRLSGTTDAVGTIDQENERVLHAAEGTVVPGETSVPAPESVPQEVAVKEEEGEEQEVTNEKGDIEPKPEEGPSSVEVKDVKVEDGGEETFDDVPI